MGNREARTHLARALELAPDYARAYAYIAVMHGRDTMLDHSGDLNRRSVQEGLEAAVTAIRPDPRLPNAYFARTVLNLAIGEHDRALSAARHSIWLNRNFADGYAALAEASVHGGALAEALDAIRHAKRLHPHHPARYDWIEGHVLFQMGDASAVRAFSDAAVSAAPGFVPAVVLLAAAHAELGEADQARAVLATVGAIAPRMSIEAYLASAPHGIEARRRHLARAIEAIAIR